MINTECWLSSSISKCSNTYWFREGPKVWVITLFLMLDWFLLIFLFLCLFKFVVGTNCTIHVFPNHRVICPFSLFPKCIFCTPGFSRDAGVRGLNPLCVLFSLIKSGFDNNYCWSDTSICSPATVGSIMLLARAPCSFSSSLYTVHCSLCLTSSINLIAVVTLAIVLKRVQYCWCSVD